MKFLLDMNVPHDLGHRLESVGHAWRHVANLGMSRARDIDIMAEASSQDEIIITHDLDFGYLLSFSGDSKPSVIIFRVRNTHPNNLFTRITSVWSEIEKPLHSGAIVTIEDATLRIRKLPI
jgi:predicted nuclease of predicted toxin-antitoxin system